MSGKEFKLVLKPRYQYWFLILPFSNVFITVFAIFNYLILGISIKKTIKIIVLFFAYAFIFSGLIDLFPGFFAWLEQTEFGTLLYIIIVNFPMGLYLIKLQESDINKFRSTTDSDEI